MKNIVMALLLLTLIAPSIAATDSTSVKKELTKEKIYEDAKSAIQQLAEALKVGSEHVYGILVRQQIVKSITWSIILVSSILFVTFFAKGFGNPNEKWCIDNGDLKPTFLGVIRWMQGISGLVMFVVSVFSLNTIVTGFVNPEYGAIEKIIELIK